MRYHFTNYWKTEWEIILNKLDWEGFKKYKIEPNLKIIKQVDLSHCSLQSEMILDKCWTTAKHKFPHLLGKPVFCETHPAHCNTARTSELFSCQVPWDIHRASCVVPPYQRAGTWKPSRSAVLGCFLPFQSRNSVRHAASQTSMVSTGPSSCSVPPIPILLCTLQNRWEDSFPTSSTDSPLAHRRVCHATCAHICWVLKQSSLKRGFKKTRF